MLFRSSTIAAIGAGFGPDTSQHRRIQVGSVVIGDVSSFREWAVECDDVGSDLFVHLPVSGKFESRHRGVEVVASRSSVPVYRPGSGFGARWEAGSRSSCVGFAPGAVDAGLAGLLGDDVSAGMSFDPVMDTTGGLGRAWTDLVLLLGQQLGTTDGLLAEPLIAAPLAESLLNGFLLSSSHAHSEALAAPVTAARPVAIRMAVDLIEAEPQAPLTVERIAAYAGVGVRTLQSGFRKHLGMSPMAFVRSVRLQRAHEELRAADPSTATVAATAHRWGFRHMGRFAAAHEARYGETPVMALRGRRLRPTA
ncbi:transcriptional regulator, AraC family [Streptomyces sp. DvalAA-14]|uniref:AraC family transcriptional regulator n=1 Tax=unclassified Streptomyces TaxID=2593676 RepID=UPI00081BAE50|nr:MULTISPECIES: AraC family transcriptional regulator [unclassified Streptomyces]MYS20953.1 helix-turn-helix domain-containing protein [Streptomyces sp. SID4948]SCD80764.1 transcriptional regulator, AraC family [Streptomyces sp. DvalAA-14]